MVIFLNEKRQLIGKVQNNLGKMEAIMKTLQLLFVSIVFLAQPLIAQEFKLPPSTNILGVEGPDVRIWGWSRTGNVALSTEGYIQHPVESMFGIRFIILNLVSDEILFSVNISGKYVSDDNEILVMYETQRTGIMNAMRNNGIIEHHTPLLEFPIVMDNFRYTAYTRIVEENKTEYVPRVTFNIIVARNGREKIIRKDTNLFGEDNIIGYYKSPFENRILVVSGIYRYFAAVDHVEYNFTGCNLSVGF